jgi:hypothetical protein
MSEYDLEVAERKCDAIPQRSPEIAAKHRARAIDNVASHLCSTDLTDGFCGPRDGQCFNPGRGRNARLNCMARAESIMQAVESRGCTVVWVFDKAMGGVSDG